MSFVISIISFLACVGFAIYIIKGNKSEHRTMVVVEILIASFCLGSAGLIQLMDFSVLEVGNPGYTITIDDELIEEYKLKLDEDEKKEDRRFYIDHILDLAKTLLTYILGLLTPYIAKRFKRFLIKRKKKRKKRKREKEELKRKNQ